ncbi:MAG: hypothetical protein GY928_17370 [Colwellia sp.]|nr:hypothetical protein [Colwellia sp.]
MAKEGTPPVFVLERMENHLHDQHGGLTSLNSETITGQQTITGKTTTDQLATDVSKHLELENW